MTTTLPQPAKRTRPAKGPGAEPDGKTATKPGARPGDEPGTKPGTKPGAKPGSKSGVRPGAKPGTKPGAKPAARPANRPAARTRPPARAPRTPFVLLIVGLLGGALISLLLLNTVLAEDAFRLNDLQRQNTELLQREQALKVDVKKAEAPGVLAKRARELGMRPGPASPRFADAQHPAIGTAARLAGHKAKKKGKKAKNAHGRAAHPAGTAKPRTRRTAPAQDHHRRNRATPAPSASDDGAFAGGRR